MCTVFRGVYFYGLQFPLFSALITLRPIVKKSYLIFICQYAM